MSKVNTKSKAHSATPIAVLMLAAVVFVAANVQSCLAQRPQQRTFSSAEEAANVLFLAVQNHDAVALVEILGADGGLVSTGDNVQDKLEHEQFVRKYQEMHRVVREPDKSAVLYVGAENWPFPVPLVSKSGIWCFDSVAGSNEVLCRRIGENETMAIGTFRLLVLAEQEYRQRREAAVPEYTTRFVGTNDTQNGLDWKGNSVIPRALARAGIDGQVTTDNSAGPFYGYYFRILAAQGKHASGGAKSYISNGKMTGGFAFVAYPAKYRSSGVKTFIADADGNVYEKDLGTETARIATSMAEYDPDPSWHVAEQYAEKF